MNLVATPKILPLTIMLASSLAVPSVFAQSSGPVLEEVVVTAQKREESLQDTPISMAAYGQDAIEAMGFNSAKDVGLASPSLQTPAFPTNSNNLGFFIRGVGNADSIILTKDNTVGVYYDGVYSGRHTGVLADLVDLERVEILRGPQGTLYGRNTTAGAVNFISSKPTGELGIEQTLTAGNQGYFKSLTNLDLPDVAGLKSKLSLVYSERDGWVDNKGPNKVPGNPYKDFYKEENQGVRIALRYDGVENLVLDYSFDYSDMTTTPPYFQYGGPTGIGAGFDGSDIVASYGSRQETTKSPFTGQNSAYYLPDTDTDVAGHNFTLSFEISDSLQFKSITGYRDLNDDLSQNFANSFGGGVPFETHVKTNWDQFTQEFQLIGSLDRFQYVAGLYYLDENGDAKESQYLNRELVDTTGIIAFDSNGPCVSGAFGAPPPACNVLDPFFFPVYLGEFTVSSDVESISAYGQSTWTPNILQDRLDLTAGIRYTDDDREAKRTNDGILWNSFPPGENGEDLNHVDWLATANYRWTDTVSTYAKVSTSFRSGGSSPRSMDFSQTFDEETLVSYELGVKSELAGGRVRVNGAVFRMDIDDVILDYLPDPVNAPSITEIVNAGDVEIYGAELDVLAAVTDYFTVGFNYAWLDYDFTGVVFPDGSNRTESTELVWAPEHAYSVVADYNLPLADVGVLKMHLDYAWQDDQYSLANTDPIKVKVGDFGLLNGRIALDEVELAGGIWQLAVWAKNLTDEDDVNYQIGTTSSTFLQPRTYGMDVKFRY